jgi:hypothetical protein
MPSSDDPTDPVAELKCPECRATLKRRRSRTPDACEMVCGGCGKLFDICEAEALKKLKDSQS